MRDAEIEALMRDYVEPLLKAAGLRSSRHDIVLVNSRQFNAFVSGNRIFINTGAIVQAETPNEIIAVMAHEIGHLAGGHQDRLRQQIERAQTIAVVAALLGAGAVVAGGASGNGQIAGAGGGLAVGGAEIARRGLLSYQRSEERTADIAAVKYLEATGQSTKGLLTTFERLAGSRGLSTVQRDPYQSSHPLPRERIASLEEMVKASPNYNKKDAASLQKRHDMARAKILAYLYGKGAVDALSREKPGSFAALYGDAIATFLYSNPSEGARKLDALIRKEPNNPYLHEIKGEALLLARDSKGAVDAFTKAVQLTKGREPLMQVALGHALVLNGDEQSLRRAVGELEVAISLDPVNSNAYGYLAMAYGRLNDPGNAQLATAEQRFHAGKFKEAKGFAARAKRQFPKNAAQQLRADDIIQFKIPKK